MDNDSNEDPDDWTDEDDEEQPPRDGFCSGVKCNTIREYELEKYIYRERVKLYVKDMKQARGIYVKIIAD